MRIRCVCPAAEAEAEAAASNTAAGEVVATLVLIETVAALIELSTSVAAGIGSTDAALIEALTDAILAPCEGLECLENPIPAPYRMTPFVRHGNEP